MKKVLVLLSLLCSAVMAQAQVEEWYILDEAEGVNVQLEVDIRSFVMGRDKDKTEVMLGAKFHYVENGITGKDFIFVTPVTTCKNMSGPLLLRELRNNAWVTGQQFYWSEYGTKMYDLGGIFLCNAYNKVVAPKRALPGRNSV